MTVQSPPALPLNFSGSASGITSGSAKTVGAQGFFVSASTDSTHFKDIYILFPFIALLQRPNCVTAIILKNKGYVSPGVESGRNDKKPLGRNDFFDSTKKLRSGITPLFTEPPTKNISLFYQTSDQKSAPVSQPPTKRRPSYRTSGQKAFESSALRVGRWH